ncbi:MAG: 4-phosphoerythronate dehydrogenase, partial [Bacteroidales bacterium]|nr:4-phosphoerythronate dehydrogenase [Bacteroidales bacterium]
ASVLIVRSVTNCGSELLAGSNLDLLVTATTGDDHIDKDFCRNSGILWRNTKGANTRAVAEFVITSILHMAVKCEMDLQKSVLGIIGCGNIGSEVNKLAGFLGMETLVNDPPRVEVEGKEHFVDLDELIKNADIISFHVPLTHHDKNKTFHLADYDFFEEVRRKPVIVNTSRGAVINSLKLKEALSVQKLGGFVLDVWENEPFPDVELINNADISTPHIAGYSLDSKIRATLKVVEILKEFYNWSLNPEYVKDQLYSQIKRNYLEFSVIQGLSQISDIFKKAYDLESDSETFKANPGKFSYLRNNYKYRPEFKSFSVKQKKCAPELSETLSNLGFNIIVT